MTSLDWIFLGDTQFIPFPFQQFKGDREIFFTTEQWDQWMVGKRPIKPIKMEHTPIPYWNPTNSVDEMLMQSSGEMDSLESLCWFASWNSY